jgi:hypothetical protein
VSLKLITVLTSQTFKRTFSIVTNIKEKHLCLLLSDCGNGKKKMCVIVGDDQMNL